MKQLATLASTLLVSFAAPAFAQSADEAAIARHISGVSESTGKPVPTEIELMMVWQKRGGDWKLLARQAYKL